MTKFRQQHAQWPNEGIANGEIAGNAELRIYTNEKLGTLGSVQERK
jgi:hypothetical protein